MTERCPGPARGGGLTKARLRPLAFVALLAVGLWAGAGIRRLDPSREFAVLDGPLRSLFPLRVDSSFAFAPPGLCSLSRYPKGEAELPLPRAAEARIRRSDGARFGFFGSAVLRVPEARWLEVHRASRGRGLSGVLLEAVREAASGLTVLPSREGPIADFLSAEIAERLRARLGERGIGLDRLEGVGLDLLDAGEAPDIERPDTRILLVGLDGADWAILDPLIASGRLPNLARLVREGARAKLMTISPTLSPVVWTTIATGVEPERHGILDFLVPAKGGGPPEPVTSAERKAAALWEILSEAGISVGIVGWWATWPAEPVRGYMVSDRVAYQLFGIRPNPNDSAGKSWPADLYGAVRPRILAPEAIRWEDILPYLEGPRRRPEEFDGEEQELLREFRTLVASGRTYLDVALALQRERPARFEAVYFEGTDTVGHLFARYRPPRLPGVPARRYESFRGVVDRYYETVDEYLGRLLDRHGPGWTILVVSDHGFATDETRPRTTDPRIGHGAAADWHRRFGILILSGAHIARGKEIAEATVYDIAPTLLALFGLPVPSSWPGRVLAEAIEPSFFDEVPVRFQPGSPERPSPLVAEQGGGTDPEASALVEKLRNLGYIGSATGARPEVTTRNNEGLALLARGRFAEAERAFREALVEQPGQPQLLVNLGIALRLQGRAEEARPLLEKALANPVTKRMAGQELAQIEFHRGDLDSAERYCRLVLEAEPQAADVLHTLGLLEERRGRFAAAEEAYRRAAEADPDAAEPRNNLGNLAKARGRLAEAERWYERAIEADPHFMGAYNNLALVYQERGQLDKAIEWYGKALAKEPANAIVLNNLGSLYYAKGNLPEARRLWEEASRADPRYASPLNNLAGIEIAQGRWEAAETLLRRALDLDPHYGDARINLALVERARGRPEAARAELEKAAEDPRARPAALAQLGALLLGQGKAAEALAPLEEARRLDATPSTLNALGECYRQLGRRAEAKAAWQASLALDPRQEAVRRSLERLD